MARVFTNGMETLVLDPPSLGGPYDRPCEAGGCAYPGRHTHLFCAGAWVHPSFGDRPYLHRGFRACGVGLPWPEQYVSRIVPGGVVIQRWGTTTTEEPASCVPCVRCGQPMLAYNGPTPVFG